jgi:4-hydroxybenzoate polyprenyltransferase
MFAGLLLLGLIVALALGTEFLLVMLGYYVVTLAYSLSLKRRAIIDKAGFCSCGYC